MSSIAQKMVMKAAEKEVKSSLKGMEPKPPAGSATRSRGECVDINMHAI